jgi:hypothetical protein
MGHITTDQPKHSEGTFLMSYCCTATCSRTNTAAAVAGRIFQNISATNYTSISEIQWRLATSYRVEVAKLETLVIWL